VPTEIEPMLSKYVTEGFYFVAVLLHPDVGVQAMRPIRVSFPGKLPSLPLRMVAAGVGEHVGLKLFVVGDGRWRTANFPSFLITAAELTWDFALERSDYTAIRQQIADGLDGRAFALEASIDLSAGSLPPVPFDAGVGADAFHVDADAGVDAEVEVDALAAGDSPTETDDAAETDGDLDADADTAPPADAATSADAGPVPGIDPTTSDREIVFGKHGYRRFTRLRADLPSKYLDVDLALEADVSQLTVPRDLRVTASMNDSVACPPSSGRGSSGGAGCECETEASASPTTPVMAAALAFAFASLVRARRRRAARRRDV